MLALGLPTTAFCIPSVKLRIKSAPDVPQVPAVPRKRFGSADCDTIYYIHLSLCTQPAVPNLFEVHIVWSHYKNWWHNYYFIHSLGKQQKRSNLTHLSSYENKYIFWLFFNKEETFGKFFFFSCICIIYFFYCFVVRIT